MASINGHTETNDSYLLAVNSVSEHVFPRNASKIQKRFLRRYLRKPLEVSTRQYAARVSEINDYFAYFPIEGNEAAPTKLPVDEIVDILEFGCPPKWQRQMILQDFDAGSSTVSQFVSFCDRIERASDFSSSDSKSRRPDKSEERRSKKARRSSRDAEERSRRSGTNKLYCSYHGMCNHATKDCEHLGKKKKSSRGYPTNDSKKK